MLSLQKKLEDIVSRTGSKTENHPAEIEALKNEMQHSIILIALHDPMKPYNCLAYALGVTESVPIRRLMRIHYSQSINFGSGYMSRLISKGILKENKSKGSVIIYFKDARPTHAGLLKGDRVTSKWGRGCLWEHDIREVPDSYGEEYKVFLPPAQDVVEREFQNYSKKFWS